MLSYLLLLIEDEEDAAFFNTLYEKYEKQMWFRAYDVIKDDMLLAEDAVQEAFIGIAKNIKTVRGLDEQRVRSYLLTAAKNAAIDIIRHNSKELVINSIFDNYSFNRNEIAQAEERNYVIHIIDGMPQIYRDILYCRFVLELSEKEIANTLKLNLNTVRQQIARGKRMFISRYEKGLNESDN